MSKNILSSVLPQAEGEGTADSCGAFGIQRKGEQISCFFGKIKAEAA